MNTYNIKRWIGICAITYENEVLCKTKFTICKLSRVYAKLFIEKIKTGDVSGLYKVECSFCDTISLDKHGYLD